MKAHRNPVRNATISGSVTRMPHSPVHPTWVSTGQVMRGAFPVNVSHCKPVVLREGDIEGVQHGKDLKYRHGESISAR